jgi:hypothetical protein
MILMDLDNTTNMRTAAFARAAKQMKKEDEGWLRIS